jgi:hypothetical protein
MRHRYAFSNSIYGTVESGVLWSSLPITHLWTFVKGLWNHRDQIMHGNTGEEIATWIMTNLQDQVRQDYMHFQADTSYVLA